MISTCGSLRTSPNENDTKVATLRKVRTWNCGGFGLLASCLNFKFCLRFYMYSRNSQEHPVPAKRVLLLPFLHWNLRDFFQIQNTEFDTWKNTRLEKQTIPSSHFPRSCHFDVVRWCSQTTTYHLDFLHYDQLFVESLSIWFASRADSCCIKSQWGRRRSSGFSNKSSASRIEAWSTSNRAIALTWLDHGHV